MGRKVPGPWFVVAVIVIASGAVWLVSSVWLSPHRADLATFWSFAAAIVGLAASLIIYVSKIRSQGEPSPSRALDDVADLLAGAVKDQWTRAAADRRLVQTEPIPVRWQRPCQAYAGPTSAAAGSERFRPLPELPAIEEGQLQHGQLRELHAVYGGLGSGRLVIVGAPGSGKSGAAVLLVLAALKYREEVSDKDRPLVPVPIMFTLHGWDPNAQPVHDWLATRLQHTYPQFAGKRGAAEAAGLVMANKVAVILDGLDEIPRELRPVALQALSDQTTFRLVVLARSAEMAAAAKQYFLEGAAVLELQHVDPATAAEYLTRVQRDPPPAGWGELTALLRGMPDSPIAKALSSPLTLTLVRDTYRANDDVREFLDVCNTAGRSGEEIEDYLLDRVLPVAYAPRPGQKPLRYDPQAAQHALRYIAARMTQDQTRDLEWWNIRQWARRWPRAIATVLLLGLAGGLAGGLVAGLIIGLAAASAAGLWAGLTLGEDDPPERIWRLRWRQIFSGQSLLVLQRQPVISESSVVMAAAGRGLVGAAPV